MTSGLVRRTLLLGSLLLIALVGPGVANAQQMKVRFGYFPAMVDIPVFVAESQGFFTKNGLDVEMISFSTGPALIGAILSGSVNFIDGGGALLSFPQVTRGHNLRGVANFWAQNLYTLVVRNSVPTPNANRPYPAPALDLKGKRIGVVALGSTTSAMVESVLKDAGLKPGEDVILVPAGGIPTATAALIAGNIDGYLSFPPMNQMLDALHPGSYKVVFAAPQFPPLLRVNFFNHVGTTQEFIDKNPRAVQAMCKAIRDGLQWLQDPKNFDAAVVGLEKWLPGSPPGVVAAALKASMPLLKLDEATLGKITPEAVKHGNDQLVDLGYLKEGVSYDTYVYKACN
jgi:NitT/TauT family transport system substrate-binding protein